MKFIISIFLLGFVYAQAQTPRKVGPFELMTVLDDTPLLKMNSDYTLNNAFSGEKVPKGFKLVVDKNFRSAPDGMYRVYAVPENSDFNTDNTKPLSDINANFKTEYENSELKAKENCTPEEVENPYKCLPYFYVTKSKVGVETSLEQRVVEAATGLNQTVNQAVVDPLNSECSDCETAQSEEPADTDQSRTSQRLLSSDCQIRLSGSMVNCNSKDKTMRSHQDVEKMVCLYHQSSKTFCPGISEDLRRIEIAADVMGLDKRQMACMVLIESAFQPKQCSGAGACGIAQFTSQGAIETKNRIKDNYVNEWNEFQRRVGGTPFQASQVSVDNIRGGHVSFGIFAMATYLRDALVYKGGSNLEGTWKNYIQRGGNPRFLFHAQIAAYNWKPAEFDNITTSLIRSGTTPLNFSGSNGNTPAETDRFIKAFNDCMYKDSSNDWTYKGSNPSASKRNECNLSNNQPVCRNEDLSF